MTHLAMIADRVLNRPLLIHPQKADLILWVLGGRIGIENPPPDPEANRFVGQPKTVGRQIAYNVSNGAAIITIEGSLVNRGAWLGAASGLVSYEGIEAQMMTALADANVQSIVLDIDSPGGEATGMYALAAKIRSARNVKPIVALVNDMAASAAYGIASQADQIVISPTSVVGSVGVVLLHLDVSKMMEMRGQAATLIYAGAHKVDGHPFAPLPDDVRADLQRDVETFYDRFVETVVAGRGDAVTEEEIRGTEARTYIGRDAIRQGLADKVGVLADAIRTANNLADQGEPTSTAAKPARRAEKPSSPAAGAGHHEDNQMEWKDATAESLRQNRPDVAAAIEGNVTAKVAEGKAAGIQEGRTAAEATAKQETEKAVTAERDRIAGIRAVAFDGQDELVAQCVKDGLSVGDAAQKLTADYKAKGQHLDKIKGAETKVTGLTAAPNAGASGGGATAKTPDEWKAEYAGSADLQAQFASADNYVAFKKNEDKVRIQGQRKAA